MDSPQPENKTRGLLLALLALIALALALVFQDSPAWYRLIPTAEVWLLARLAALLPGAVILARCARGVRGEGRLRKGALTGLLGLALLAYCFQDLARPAPASLDRWQRGVCLQSHPSSCSAAAAATLLGTRGIQASEAAMIEACRTTTAGTRPLGLIRGLHLQVRGTPWRLELGPADVEAALASGEPFLTVVGLREREGVDPRYARDWGWTAGVDHAVVVFGPLPGERLDIGDPSTGREAWSRQNLKDLWRGFALRLVRR